MLLGNKMLLQSRAGELHLTALKTMYAATAKLWHTLDEIAKFRTLLPTSTSILTLRSSASGLATSTAASNLLGLLVRRLSL